MLCVEKNGEIARVPPGWELGVTHRGERRRAFAVAEEGLELLRSHDEIAPTHLTEVDGERLTGALSVFGGGCGRRGSRRKGRFVVCHPSLSAIDIGL